LKQVGFELEVQLLQEMNVVSVSLDGIKIVQQILQLELLIEEMEFKLAPKNEMMGILED